MKKNIDKHLNKLNLQGREAASILLKDYFMCLEAVTEEAHFSKTEKEAIYKTVRSSSENRDVYLNIVGTMSVREKLLYLQGETAKSLLNGLDMCLHIYLQHGQLIWKAGSQRFIKTVEAASYDQSTEQMLKESFRYSYVLFALLKAIDKFHDIQLLTQEILRLKEELDSELANIMMIYGYNSITDVGIEVSGKDLLNLEHDIHQTPLEDLKWYDLLMKLLAGDNRINSFVSPREKRELFVTLGTIVTE